MRSLDKNRDEELRQNLLKEGLGFYERKKGKYPVICLNFKDIFGNSFETIENGFKDVIK